MPIPVMSCYQKSPHSCLDTVSQPIKEWKKGANLIVLLSPELNAWEAQRFRNLLQNIFCLPTTQKRETKGTQEMGQQNLKIASALDSMSQCQEAFPQYQAEYHKLKAYINRPNASADEPVQAWLTRAAPTFDNKDNKAPDFVQKDARAAFLDLGTQCCSCVVVGTRCGISAKISGGLTTGPSLACFVSVCTLRLWLLWFLCTLR
jgi:hypothetical protein